MTWQDLIDTAHPRRSLQGELDAYISREAANFMPSSESSDSGQAQIEYLPSSGVQGVP